MAPPTLGCCFPFNRQRPTVAVGEYSDFLGGTSWFGTRSCHRSFYSITASRNKQRRGAYRIPQIAFINRASCCWYYCSSGNLLGDLDFFSKYDMKSKKT